MRRSHQKFQRWTSPHPPCLQTLSQQPLGSCTCKNFSFWTTRAKPGKTNWELFSRAGDAQCPAGCSAAQQEQLDDNGVCLCVCGWMDWIHGWLHVYIGRVGGRRASLPVSLWWQPRVGCPLPAPPIDCVLILTTTIWKRVPQAQTWSAGTVSSAGFQRHQIPVFLFPATEVRILESRSPSTRARILWCDLYVFFSCGKCCLLLFAWCKWWLWKDLSMQALLFHKRREEEWRISLLLSALSVMLFLQLGPSVASEASEDTDRH